MRALAVAGVVVGVAVLVVIGLFWAFQRQLIYVPGPAPALTAAEAGAQEVRLRTDDDVELTAWFFAATGPPRDATVLLAPGNAGNRAARVPLARALADSGLDVLALEYRGFGGNAGSPSEEGLASDARAAHDHLTGERGVDPARIVLFGESLGAAVAVRLATERPSGPVVLRSPFTSLADVGARVYPWLPVRLLLRDRFPSIERVGALTVPVTVVAGTADEIVPVDQSRSLARAAGVEAIEVPGARHNDPELAAGQPVVDATVAAVP